MTTHEAEIRSARADEAARVADVLRVAFDEDPVINWMLRADAGRDRAFADFFAANVDEYFGAGRRVDIATVAGEPAAAAMWTPPPGAQATALRDRLGLWGLRGWTGIRRFPRFWRMVSATESRYPSVPHHYLFMIGARPEYRGRGLASRLLATVLAECDRDRIPAYLENSSALNLPLYERHGFVVREELSLGRHAPPLFLMWREPRR